MKKKPVKKKFNPVTYKGTVTYYNVDHHLAQVSARTVKMKAKAARQGGAGDA